MWGGGGLNGELKLKKDMIIKGEQEPFAKSLRGCSKRNLENNRRDDEIWEIGRQQKER